MRHAYPVELVKLFFIVPAFRNDRVSALSEPFQENERLVSGTHTLSWDELASNFGATHERQMLLERFKLIAQDLKAAKIENVEIGGSFPATKAAPQSTSRIQRASPPLAPAEPNVSRN